MQKHERDIVQRLEALGLTVEVSGASGNGHKSLGVSSGQASIRTTMAGSPRNADQTIRQTVSTVRRMLRARGVPI